MTMKRDRREIYFDILKVVANASKQHSEVDDNITIMTIATVVDFTQGNYGIIKSKLKELTDMKMLKACSLHFSKQSFKEYYLITTRGKEYLDLLEKLNTLEKEEK